MVIILMGVCGCGKTTVGKVLSKSLNKKNVKTTFVDADDFHPIKNIEKMKRGKPLNESDRLPWLKLLNVAMLEWIEKKQNVVLACSALTQQSRILLGIEAPDSTIVGDDIKLVYLQGDKDLIARRIKMRTHFMPEGLLESQFITLEPPAHALILDIQKSVESLVEETLKSISLP